MESTLIEALILLFFENLIEHDLPNYVSENIGTGDAIINEEPKLVELVENYNFSVNILPDHLRNVFYTRPPHIQAKKINNEDSFPPEPITINISEPEPIKIDLSSPESIADDVSSLENSKDNSLFTHMEEEFSRVIPKFFAVIDKFHHRMSSIDMYKSSVYDVPINAPPKRGFIKGFFNSMAEFVTGTKTYDTGNKNDSEVRIPQVSENNEKKPEEANYCGFMEDYNKFMAEDDRYFDEIHDR